ncbi:bZIP transcription factor 12-like [Lolium rigidum]|uniref:bZIP transcription factor 12-like n=1 Tax=Lolium rigidum TaxID=89674 RepID=UPI001F5C6137|nr:bZIP transcription factor 12-like [Lolium rigidum]
MASSRVMAASSQPPATASASDLARFRSASGIGSMNMDDILRNIYGEAPPAGAGGDPPPAPDAAVAARRTAEEVWKEISATGGLSAPVPAPAPAGGGGADPAVMTLEDFLAREEEARVAGVEGPMAVVFPDAAEGAVAAARRRGGGGAAAGGRGRKRALMDPMDRAATQRQKRMIKNRESAARSRERKQAYIAELEAQVTQLEEEHAELLREQEEQNEKRLNELKEQAFQVVIRKKPSQDLRRTNSMEW